MATDLNPRYLREGQSSIELHIRLHIVDIQDCLAGLSPYPLLDVMESLERLVNVRVKDKLSHFDQDLMKRLCIALLRVTKMRERGILQTRIVPESHVAFRIFAALLAEVIEFQLAVEPLTAEELSRKLLMETRCHSGADEYILRAASSIVACLRALFPLRYSSLDAFVDEDDVEDFQKLIEKYAPEGGVSLSARRYPAQGAYFDTPVARLGGILKTDLENGLKEEEVLARQEFFGANELPSPPAPSVLQILFKQVSDFLVILLLVAAVASMATGELESGIVLFVVIIINMIIGFLQEWKALKTLSQITTLSVPSAEVVRDGKLVTVLAKELVPGDIVKLEEGARVPADLRLFELSELETVEGVLTGESMPIKKHTDAIKGKTANLAVGDRMNMAFLSTMVARGRGAGIVVAIGVLSEAGKISANLAESEGYSKTPLQKKLARLGMWLVAVAMVLCLLVVILGVARGMDAVEVVKMGVSLAVSAVPEGLVAVSTVVMALGVKRMSERNAVVRQLPSVETLGSVTYICSDKTGTLTEGQMAVESFQTLSNSYEFDRRAKTKFVGHEDNAKLPDELRLLLLTCTECNNASYEVKEDGTEVCHGDPTEVALVQPGVIVNVQWSDAVQRIHENPFDSSRKRMSVVMKLKNDGDGDGDDNKSKLPHAPFLGKRFALLKGAPEAVLKCCKSLSVIDDGVLKPDTDIDSHITKLKELESTLAARGLRVLGLAGRSLPEEEKEEDHEYTADEVETDCTFFGLVGLMDPPRSTAQESVELCHHAGIKVIMITGDHPTTAVAISRRLGISEGPAGPPQAEDVSDLAKYALRGDEVDVFTPQDMMRLSPFPTVFARVNPDTKLKVVKALQQRGEIVAMCGDGTNDAAAIKKAEVGVGMGSGVELTKQVADIVLLDDSFDTIVVAVREGRRVFDNLYKFVVYLLSCNSSEIFAVLIAISTGLGGDGILFTPIQILWANVFADVPEAIALGVEPADDDLMDRPPRPPKMGVLTLSSSVFIVLQGMSMAAIALVQFYFQISMFPSRRMEEVRTVAFIQLALIHLLHAFECKIPHQTVFKINLLSNRYLLLGFVVSLSLLLMGLYIPGLNHVLDQTPLLALDWACILVGCVVYLVLVELIKLAYKQVLERSRKKYNERRAKDADAVELRERMIRETVV